MTSRNLIAIAAVAGALTLAAPATATPDPDKAISLWDPFDLGGCYVTDAAGTTTFDSGCDGHLAVRYSGGEVAMAMYQDQGQLPADAVLPTTATSRDISFVNGAGQYITCSEIIVPSGEYKSKCYFNAQTQP
jgi:hypothetical protein